MIYPTRCSQVRISHLNIPPFGHHLFISLGFLSEDMTYSCAIFADLDGDMKKGTVDQGLVRLNGQPSTQDPIPSKSSSSAATTPPTPTDTDELYKGQIRKLFHIITKAKIFPGHRVLEIGSGWGSLAILLCQTIPDTTVDTLTLSVQQQSLAMQRIKAAGLEDRITVHLMDYRDMPKEWEGAFDRVISIEMIEAVGAEFLGLYWRVVDWALKKKGGVGVVQVITIPEPSKFLSNDYDSFIDWV